MTIEDAIAYILLFLLAGVLPWAAVVLVTAGLSRLVGAMAEARGRSARRWGWGAAVLLTAFDVWWLWFDCGLQSDAKMIRHFQAHRSDFEAIIEHYRDPNNPEKGSVKWDNPDIKALLERAGVKRVIGSPLSWLPNPYDIETGKKEYELIRSGKIPRQYNGVLVEMRDEGWLFGRYAKYTLRYTFVGKSYFYIPQVPKLEGNVLWSPVDERGKSSSLGRVLTTLDYYPPNWSQTDPCVYRQLEPQWFIKMCRRQ